ncbi:hypothetical protein RRG08_000400 [Elysia crispata]|uniref:C-type lectin domain-containing protein n=1 Tax=Elysia crispata TaxID=231223 RepID=A0AAE0ZTY6_9GAST|nr:hypothetical protein RRG08_000400 [Elysia crispata]
MIVLAAALVLFIQSAFDTNSSIVKSCPSAAVKTTSSKYFRVLQDNCFLFMTYDTVAYEIAKTKCQDYGGNLAMPKTKAINDFLVQEMKSFDKPRPMWIGMHDKVIKDRAMVWEDGSHVDSWGNFDWTKDGLFGGGEDCIALDPNDGKWHDYGCSKTGILSRLGVAKNTKLPFICQYSVKKDDARKMNRNSGKTRGDEGGCDGVENGSQVQSGDDDKM